MRRGRLLLLVPTTSYRIGDFLEAAGRLGVEAAVGSDQAAVLEQFSDGATTTIDFKDLALGVAQIVAYHGRYPVAAIIGVDQETSQIAAEASQALGLRHNSTGAVAAAGNKHRFRSRLANSGLPAPWFTLLSLDDYPGLQAEALPYPVVLKPLTLSASRGVIRVDDESQFIAATKRIKRILASTEARGEAANHILVEDYIPGREVALEGLLEDGRLTVLALFDKPDPLVGPYFEETIYLTPSRLPQSIQADIIEATGRGAETLGLREGPVHAELRVNDNGVWLIEIAARSIGGLCSRALEFGNGGRLEDLIIRHAMEMPGCAGSETGAPSHNASGVMMIPIPAAGTLRRVDGLADARAVPGVRDAVISIPLGDTLVPVPEGNRYLGFIFADGESPEQVEAALRSAHDALSFRIEPN